MKKWSLLFLCVLVITLLAVPVSLAVADTGTDAAAFWHLDEGTGVTAYDSAHAFHGTLNGGVSWTAGVSGTALAFDGTGYVALPSAADMIAPTTFTVATWFKTSVNHPAYGGTEGRLVNLHRTSGSSSVSALALYVEQDAVALLYYTGSSHVWLKYPTTDYYDNEWHSLAVVYDGTAYHLYYDGVEVISQVDSFGPFGGTASYLGSYNGAERFFQGSLDEIGIWGRALTAAEVADLYGPATVAMQLQVTNALIKFYDDGNGDRINIQGNLALDTANGNGVAAGEPVTVTIGTFTETFTMQEQGRRNDKQWTYTRPHNVTGNIKSVSINWKTGRFEILADTADLSGMTDPSSVLVALTIGDDVGQTCLAMREQKQWQYNGPSNGNGNNWNTGGDNNGWNNWNH